MWVTSKSFWRCVFNSEVKLFQCDDWLTILILYNNEYTMFLYVSLINSFYFFFIFQCVTLGVKRNRRRSTKKKNDAKKKTEKTKRMPEKRPCTCFFCKAGQHSWQVCPVRKEWLASREKMSHRDWIASVRE